MRLQLIVAAAVLCGTAHADGTLTMRGVYYKERATRVEQPILDGMFEAGARGLVDAHVLVDAITSASAAAGANNAQPFTKARFEAGAGYTHELDAPSALSDWVDLLRLHGEGKFSSENDYRSIYVGGRAEAELAQKNTVIGLGGGIAQDRLDNSGAQSPLGGPLLQCEGDSTYEDKSCPLRTILGSASASQIVSPNALVAITYDISHLEGFQANPYRTVVTSGGLYAEKHPYGRLRQAVALSARYFIRDTETAVIGSYRYYTDDWHIHAHTPEIRLVQQVGVDADASFRYRYYRQSAAFFAPSAYGGRYPDPVMNMIPYYTDDPKMTAFDGHLLEAKLGILGDEFDLKGNWAKARIEGIIEWIVQHNRFGDAIVAHVALTVPFSY